MVVILRDACCIRRLHFMLLKKNLQCCFVDFIDSTSVNLRKGATHAA